MKIKPSFRIYLLLILTGGFLITACTAPAKQAQYPTAETAPTDVILSTETPSPTPTPERCMLPGQVQREQMTSTLLTLEMNITVYLPPCYDEKLPGGYPVAYLLHGQTFDDQMWVGLGAAAIIDELILSGEARPFILVMPNEEFYYRAVRGNLFPDAILTEVIPWAESGFNLCDARECRAIGGISRGAAWAMRIGLTNPRVFSAIGIHSLPSFLGGEAQVAEWVKALPKDALPRLTMDSGRLDPELKSAIPVEAVFNQFGLPHDWHLNKGRHDEEYWAAHVEGYMRWYAGLWIEPE